MFDSNYRFRPKMTDCIQEFELLLDGAQKSQLRNMHEITSAFVLN